MNKYVTFLITLCIASSMHMHCSTESKKTLNFIQNVAVGSAVGMAEVAFPGQPLSYMANMVVQKKPIELMHSYKGGFANGIGIAPITAIQKVTNAQTTQWIKTAQGANLSDVQKVGVGFGAGVAGAFAATPQEAVSLYQQNHNTNASQAAKNLKWSAWRGFTPTATRDGLFCAGYQAVEPIMQNMAKSAMGDNKLASVTGSISAGVVTAVASQPFSVVKTLMQGDQHKTQYTTTLDTASQVYSRDGVQGLFKGGIARGTRVAIAIPLYAMYTKQFTHIVQGE